MSHQAYGYGYGYGYGAAYGGASYGAPELPKPNKLQGLLGRSRRQ
jgi:hypothetical protein